MPRQNGAYKILSVSKQIRKRRIIIYLQATFWRENKVRRSPYTQARVKRQKSQKRRNAPAHLVAPRLHERSHAAWSFPFQYNKIKWKDSRNVKYTNMINSTLRTKWRILFETLYFTLVIVICITHCTINKSSPIKIILSHWFCNLFQFEQDLPKTIDLVNWRWLDIYRSNPNCKCVLIGGQLSVGAKNCFLNYRSYQQRYFI